LLLEDREFKWQQCRGSSRNQRSNSSSKSKDQI